jgi:2-desacetyl-2-hydroxyethyl bacteriochlorophyllide A dehydrogenase
MRLQKRVIFEWGITRARATLKRRGVRRGARIVCQSSGWVRLEVAEILAPAPDEALVRVAISAVSPGTERAMFNRLPNTHVTYPYTPGYSAVGTVLEVGRNVRSLRPGDRVAGHISHASLACVRLGRCVRVPEGVGDREAAFVTLGVIALQGVRKAGIRFGDRVAVLGRGVLGILAARLARIAGSSEVVICGRTPPPDRGGPTRERYDVVLDATGNPDAVADAALLAAPGARIVLLGSSRGPSPPLASVLPSIEIRGAHASMVAATESRRGCWTFVDEAALYMDWLLEGRLQAFEPPVDVLDPREAWLFYRRLGKGRPRVQTAMFDWNLLPESMRFRSSTFLPPHTILRADPEGERRHDRLSQVRRIKRSAEVRGAIMRDRSRAPERKLRVAFVGCGEIALSNARAVTDSGVAEVRWAIDTRLDLATDLARRSGGRVATELAPALDDREVDAVIVCTPHHLHASICGTALAAGKHVLVEKPMARNAREVVPMIDAARAAGVVLSTCYARRFLPEIQAARSLLQEGALGRVLGARIAEHLYREMSYWSGGSSGRSRSDWRARRETSGGGVLLMNLCHHLDVLFFLTGLKAGRVYCESDRFAAPGDVEDEVAMTVRMTEGAILSVDASTCAPGGGERAFQIWGTDGQIALDDPPRFLSLKRTPFGETNDWNRLPNGTERQARRDFVRAFAAAVLRGEANPVPPEEALTVQLLIDAAYRSAERGEVMDVPSDRDEKTDVVSNR